MANNNGGRVASNAGLATVAGGLSAVEVERLNQIREAADSQLIEEDKKWLLDHGIDPNTLTSHNLPQDPQVAHVVADLHTSQNALDQYFGKATLRDTWDAATGQQGHDDPAAVDIQHHRAEVAGTVGVASGFVAVTSAIVTAKNTWQNYISKRGNDSNDKGGRNTF